jgi:hypothetical protein
MRSFSKTIFLFVILLLLSFAVIPQARAQGLTTSNDSDLLLTVKMLPENPGPDTNIDISVESYAGFDINASLITWYVNGKIIKKGVGEKNATVTSGPMGSKTVVNISVVPPNTLPFSRQIIIQPSDVDVIWEANVYTPPFYEGHSLFTKESQIVVQAFPHLTTNSGKSEVPKEDLIYRWSVNDYFYADKSGYGKSSFTYISSVFEKNEKIKVVVQTTDANQRAEKIITINPVDPQILVYENHPLYGILYNKEVGDLFSLKSQEVTLAAFPYFFSNENGLSSLDMNWSMNDMPIENLPIKNQLVLRREGDKYGIANISLSINNSKKIIQTNTKNFQINFEKNI